MIFNQSYSPGASQPTLERTIISQYLAYKSGTPWQDKDFGTDRLSGGPGADRFVWTNASHSGLCNEQACDVITDFDRSEGDKIDLRSWLNGHTAQFRNQEFIDGQEYQILIQSIESDKMISIDIDGVGGADFEIKLEGDPPLEQEDILISP